MEDLYEELRVETEVIREMKEGDSMEREGRRSMFARSYFKYEQACDASADDSRLKMEEVQDRSLYVYVHVLP